MKYSEGLNVRKRRARKGRCFLSAVLMVCLSYGVLAKPIPFLQSEESTYQLKNDPMVSFLQRFLDNQGIRAVFSGALQSDNRKLNGLRRGHPQKIYTSIVTSNGLVSYYDGLTIYLYKAEEMRREFLIVPKENAKPLQRMIRKMRLSDKENYTRVDRETGLVEISGVPRYVSQIQRLVNVAAEHHEVRQMAFHYIPLKYAWASDRVFVVGSQKVSVAGVATVLQQAIYGGSTGASSTSGETTLPASAGSLQGKGLAARGKATGNRAKILTLNEGKSIAVSSGQNNDQSAAESKSLMGTTYDDGRGPGIVADTQHNAIIIRDYPDRIPLYKELVKALDIPSPIIEIEATIIDVDKNMLHKQGVEWRLASNESNGEMMFADGGTKQNFVSALTGGSVRLLDQVPGFQIGAIIGDKNQFISRINALENDGVVKVSSRPKVATLNDMEAVIESSRSLYVPIEGAFEADLFQVFSGTVLRVTPHVIESDSRQQIRLMVAVEDGTVDVLEATDTPVATRHAVTTQAVIDTGYSLLLGGMVRDEEVTSVSKVPLLGDIPLLGELFRSESKDRRNAERLFLISPRIKLPDGSEDKLAKLKVSEPEKIDAHGSSFKSKKQKENLQNNKLQNKQQIHTVCQEECREELDSKHLLFF